MCFSKHKIGSKYKFTQHTNLRKNFKAENDKTQWRCDWHPIFNHSFPDTLALVKEFYEVCPTRTRRIYTLSVSNVIDFVGGEMMPRQLHLHGGKHENFSVPNSNHMWDGQTSPNSIVAEISGVALPYTVGNCYSFA